MSNQNLKNKSIDELREMKANVKYQEQENQHKPTQKSKQEIIE